MSYKKKLQKDYIKSSVKVCPMTYSYLSFHWAFLWLFFFLGSPLGSRDKLHMQRSSTVSSWNNEASLFLCLLPINLFFFSPHQQYCEFICLSSSAFPSNFVTILYPGWICMKPTIMCVWIILLIATARYFWLSYSLGVTLSPLPAYQFLSVSLQVRLQTCD